MLTFTFHILVVIAPLLLSNVIHMVVVKYDFLSVLAKPIWKKGLGTNKTWRAFLIVPVLNGVFLWGLISLTDWQVHNAFLLGFILGLAYLIFELPNSYFKRLAGIQSGGSSNKHGQMLILIDKMDSAFGVILIYFLLGRINFIGAVILFFLSSLTHLTISYILVQFKIKKSL